ncbi:MAG: hypothetical protein PHN44_01870 [Candidatus Marinimicrobia bacterium]|nr:hypothetical protein [Candidatus Neomarinimicrobiota bacterium]
MINSIYLKNIRNIHGESEQMLTGMDIFNGRIGTGKSTRLDAVPMTILGYLPSRGKSLDMTFRDANDDVMAVGLTADDFSAKRIFKRKDGGTGLTQEILINGEPTPSAEAEAMIAGKFGADAFVFNLGEFLSLSDNKRKEFIFNLAGAESQTHIEVQVLERICRRIVGEGEVNGLLKFKYQRESFTELEQSQVKEAVDILLQSAMNPELLQALQLVTESNTDNKQEYLNSLLTTFNNDLKTQRQIKRDAEAVNSELRRMQKEIESGENLPQLLADKEKLESELTAISVRIAENDKNKQVLRQHANQGERIRIAVAKLNEFDTAKTRTEIETTNTTIEQLIQYLEKYETQSKVISTLDLEVDSYQKSMTKLKDVRTTKLCPIYAGIICTTDIDRDIDTLHTMLAEKKDALKKAQTALKKLTTKLDNEYGKGWNPLDKLIKSLQKKVADLETAVVENEKEREFYTKEQAEWEATDVSQFNVADSQLLEVEKTGLINQKSDLNAKIDKQRTLQEKMTTIQASNISATKADARIEMDKNLIEATRDIMNVIVSGQTVPIIDTVNAILKEIDARYMFMMYMDDKERLVYGWNKDDGYTPFEALSGGETAIFSIALITALINRKNPPTKVLCIKAAEVDRESFEAMLKGLAALKSHFDNILVEYPHTIAESYDGWKVWRL